MPMAGLHTASDRWESYDEVKNAATKHADPELKGKRREKIERDMKGMGTERKGERIGERTRR